jgi:translocation and assembly module TamB
MPEEEIEQREESANGPEPAVPGPAAIEARRRYFSRRNVGLTAAAFAILLVILALFSVVFYRYGVFDSYVRTQFVAKMADIGIQFDADVFRVTVNPLALELKNATFNDRVTGEKLFFIRDAQLLLTVDDLYAWQLSRDITINTTDINGAEVWVTFDENGRSNFSNLKFVEEGPSRVNFKYNSVRFSLKDAVVHYGAAAHKISGDANNVAFFLEPIDPTVPDDQKRYKIDLTSTESTFVYDGSQLNEIDLTARGIADARGAEITELKIETPIGISSMHGTITDWAALRYDLDIESSVDLTQTSTIFPLGATLRGVGNFKGKVSGEGDRYKVAGTIDSEALTAEGVYLKALNVDATVEGTNSNYEANGRAVAELLTFEDFRVDFPRISGNVRGTGTDFRWVGELQAAAFKRKNLSLGGLFLSDAVAELKDKEFSAGAGTGRAQRFSVADVEFADVLARNLTFSRNNGVTRFNAPNGSAAAMKTKDYTIRGITGSNLRIRDEGRLTEVDIDGLRAAGADFKGNRVTDLKADSLRLDDVPEKTDIDIRNLRAGRVDGGAATIYGIESPLLAIRDAGPNTVIYSDATRVARIDAGSAVLGSLNIAGVRLLIREGRIEGRSDDIQAGNIALNVNTPAGNNGNLEDVKIVRPVFTIEPSGRYRVTADMSLGGGVVGNIPLGPARASVDASNDRVNITNLDAAVMNGQVAGTAVIGLNRRTQSRLNLSFNDLDLAKVVALQGGRIIPLEGKTNGALDLAFAGTDFDTVSGRINATVAATAGNAADGTIPVNGSVDLTAVNGLFNVDRANFDTGKTQLNATGRFDLRDRNSNLDIALNSTDANEVDRLFRVTGLAPDIERQFDELEMRFAGDLAFNGKLTGNISDPAVEGRASLGSLILRGREVGAVTADIAASPLGFELRNGKLTERAGGTVAFNMNIPRGGANNTSVQATLTNVNAGNLLAALPVDLPDRLSDFTGVTSGTVNLTGLPNAAQGEINIASSGGTVAGHAFDNLTVKAVFAGTRVDLQTAEMRFGDGFLSAKGNYDRASTVFDLDVTGKNVPLPLAASLLPQSTSIPSVAGIADFTAKATGVGDRSSTYSVTFDGSARDVVINENPFGVVTFKGNTVDQILNADLTATLGGNPQTVRATVDFRNELMPFRVSHVLDRSPLQPFFALVPQLRGLSVGGTGTGTVEFGGNLATRDAQGNLAFTGENLTGSARFSQLDLLIQDTPLNATSPVVVTFNTREITIEPAHFSGGGSNVTIAGTKALTAEGINNVTIDGRVNLALLNAFPQIVAADAFFGGYADVAVRFTGANANATLSGLATLDNAAMATFIGNDRFTFERLKGRIIFSSNQAQIENIEGYLGGGRFEATGGVVFADNLSIDRFRFGLNGTNVTVPVPQDFITTGDARLEITGTREESELSILIAGSIRARRSLYTKDIELSNIVGARHEGSISGPSALGAVKLDVTIEGRDALVVRNNIADLTASASLRVTGDTEEPQISGRITANSGTLFFRKDRYIVQRGVLEFPPDTTIEPVINLQAESEIAGYQIFVNLSGSLTDTENLIASVRSSPALPQADVISLITTGNLSNTEAGIPTLAQGGLNTAAEVLTDSIINNPARRATNRLFGLNVFEIDPIISGDRLGNPSARLTVGRQINNNLRVTYSTNLSQEQNQVLALEYRVSNKLSFVAQYEQRSLSNVTRNRDNFSFEVRFRRRF